MTNSKAATKATDKAKTPKAPKQGRPSGAKTKARAVANAVITKATCPKCGSTDHKNKRHVRGAIASGTIDGQKFVRYKHSNADCSHCGQALLVAEYELECS